MKFTGMKTKWVMMVALTSFTAQVANADCISRMVESGKIVAKRERIADKVERAGYYSAIGSLGGFLIFTPLGAGMMVGGIGAMLGVGVYSWIDRRQEKDFALTNVLAYVRGTASHVNTPYYAGSPQSYYEDLRSEVQSMHPEMTDEQIRGAVVVGDNDESLCPKGKAMTWKNTAQAVVTIVTELSGTGVSE